MKTIIKIGCLLLVGLYGAPLHSQYLLEGTLQTLVLPDSLEVTVIAARDCRECYYYLPSNFRFSFNQQDVPEVSFVSWKNDEGSKTIGGILHFLTVWGLSARQEEDLQNGLIAKVDSNGVIMGAAVVESLDPQAKIQLEGEDKWTSLLREALTSQSLIATTPGSKMAMSFRFEETAAPQIMELLEQPDLIKTHLKIELKYQVIEARTGSPVSRVLRLRIPLTYLFRMIRKTN